MPANLPDHRVFAMSSAAATPADDPALLRIDGPIATITLNRPLAFNSINLSIAQKLEQLGAAVEANDDIRVLVIEGGRLVEDGPPGRLRETPTRYRAMLDAEEALRARVWTSPLFRSLEVVDGLVRDRGAAS